MRSRQSEIASQEPKHQRCAVLSVPYHLAELAQLLAKDIICFNLLRLDRNSLSQRRNLFLFFLSSLPIENLSFFIAIAIFLVLLSRCLLFYFIDHFHHLLAEILQLSDITI